MTILEQAFASNTETPIFTIELSHSSFGTLRLARAYFDLEATLENSSTVIFTAAGIDLGYPEKSSDGRQDLAINIDNTSNEVWTKISDVITANRTSSEKVICKFRAFLESDLSEPQPGIYTFAVMETTVNRMTASIRASYTPIPDTVYPRGRYYPTTYPGVKYA